MPLTIHAHDQGDKTIIHGHDDEGYAAYRPAGIVSHEGLGPEKPGSIGGCDDC